MGDACSGLAPFHFFSSKWTHRSLDKQTHTKAPWVAIQESYKKYSWVYFLPFPAVWWLWRLPSCMYRHENTKVDGKFSTNPCKEWNSSVSSANSLLVVANAVKIEEMQLTDILGRGRKGVKKRTIRVENQFGRQKYPSYSSPRCYRVKL